MVLGWAGAEGAMDGAKAGLVVATAVSAQVLAGLVASTTRSVVLAVIHVGYVVIGYGIMGALVGMLS